MIYTLQEDYMRFIFSLRFYSKVQVWKPSNLHVSFFFCISIFNSKTRSHLIMEM